MHRIEGLPRKSTKALNVVGAVLLLVAAIPLFGVSLVIARPLAVLLLLVGVPLLWLHGLRTEAKAPDEQPGTEEHHGVRVPPSRLLTSGHAWLAPAPRRLALVGADDLLLRALGPVEQVRLPASGARIPAGGVLFALQRGDRTVEVRAPFAAEVVARNEALLAAPGVLDSDPYARGWVLRIRPAVRMRGPGVLGVEQASAWFREQVDRLLTRVAPAPVPAMPDGGVISPDFHELIDARTWRAVRDEFFD